MTAITIAAPTGEKDDIYYWNNVCFSVEGVLFKVSRHQFILGSDYFAEKYNLREMNDADTIVELEGVTGCQFRALLKLLYPSISTSTTITLTRNEWLDVLTLSNLWYFNDFRKLAIHHLERELSDPVDLIQLGRTEHVSRWVLSGYEALVNKNGAITEVECDGIGHQTATRVYVVRYAVTRCGGPFVVEDELRTKFAEEILAIEEQEDLRRTKEDLEQQRKQAEEEERRAEESRIEEEDRRAEELNIEAKEKHKQEEEEESREAEQLEKLLQAEAETTRLLLKAKERVRTHGHSQTHRSEILRLKKQREDCRQQTEAFQMQVQEKQHAKEEQQRMKEEQQRMKDEEERRQQGKRCEALKQKGDAGWSDGLLSPEEESQVYKVLQVVLF